MVQLKKLKLINFCGYKTFELDLTDGDIIKKWFMLFGTNGCGKSNFLEAVRLLATPSMVSSRPDPTLFFRRLTYHPDYQPGYEGFDTSRTQMYMEAVFSTDEGDKRVVISNNWNPAESGLIVNEISSIGTPILYVDADKPSNMNIFQINAKYKNEFEDFAAAVYGFKCYVPDDPVFLTKSYNRDTGKYIDYYTDFVITKFGNTKVHFKRMSAGEKKIATMIRTLFNRAYDIKQYGILLIDNIEMHIYFKRHMILLEKLSEYFGDRQIIATTHSPVIIENMDDKYLCDIETFIGRGDEVSTEEMGGTIKKRFIAAEKNNE